MIEMVYKFLGMKISKGLSTSISNMVKAIRSSDDMIKHQAVNTLCVIVQYTFSTKYYNAIFKALKPFLNVCCGYV